MGSMTDMLKTKVISPTLCLWVLISVVSSLVAMLARWPGGKTVNFESRGPWFDPHWQHPVVSLSKAQ